MKFRPTPLQNAFLIDLDKRGDERGFFARVFCRREFEQHGLIAAVVQVNTSLSAKAGTLRGLHYQLPPAAEVKVVRCVRGALFDVIVDLRPDSPTFGRWYGAELSEDNRTMMYVPRGFAHAILTLRENTEALYFVSDYYSPESEKGIRWNDQKFAIEWPIAPTEISAKDMNWPSFDQGFHGIEQLRGIK